MQFLGYIVSLSSSNFADEKVRIKKLKSLNLSYQKLPLGAFIQKFKFLLLITVCILVPKLY